MTDIATTPHLAGSEPRSSIVAMYQLIDIYGSFPAPDGPAVNVMGMVHSFAGNFRALLVPPCAGETLPINQHVPLFALIGTFYGGDGHAFFALPDLRGRAAIGGNPGEVNGQALTMTWMIAAEAAPGDTVPSPLVGAIGLFAGSATPHDFEMPGYASTTVRLPSGWLPADGSLVPAARYPALFDVIGETYGAGAGGTFALPNLTGRTAVGIAQGMEGPPIALGQPVAPSDNMNVAGLGLNYIVCAEGVMPSRDGAIRSFYESNAVVGEIVAYAGATVPPGWAVADGRLIPVEDNWALFDVLGTTYGGDGQANFALPDLRGRSVVGNADSVERGFI